MVNIDTLNNIFTETQNDMQQMIAAIKEEFLRPETDRETVRMWTEMPLVLKEAITARNPKLAQSLNKKEQQLKNGGIDYGSR